MSGVKLTLVDMSGKILRNLLSMEIKQVSYPTDGV